MKNKLVAIAILCCFVLGGCSSMNKEPNYTEYDVDKINLVNKAAHLRAVQVIWVNPPKAKKKKND
jgi:ABC-type uncharacterized transport system auxiliary subunit